MNLQVLTTWGVVGPEVRVTIWLFTEPNDCFAVAPADKLPSAAFHTVKLARLHHALTLTMLPSGLTAERSRSSCCASNRTISFQQSRQMSQCTGGTATLQQI